MSQTFGIELPRRHAVHDEQPPVRYVVLIDDAGSAGRVARLFLADREAVALFDAGAPEVRLMTEGLEAAHSALQPEWDRPLAGHSAEERASAEIYTLDI